jgi:hypothetical protein
MPLPFDHGVAGRTLVDDPDEPDRSRAGLRGFTAWVREWPRLTGFRRHCKIIPALPRPQPVQGGAPHLVSAHATTARLVLGQEAVSDKSNETTAIRSGTELKSLPFRCPLLHCVGQT